MVKKQDGFSHLGMIALAVVVLGAIGLAGWKVYGGKNEGNNLSSTSEKSACPAQPMLTSPADLSLATSVLYPGQVRGNDYKAHGGLRFDNSKNHEITVKVPLEAKLTSGSRYIEQGEIQYLLEFTTACGIKYRFDHLLTLTDKFQKAVNESLPAAKPDDSRTSDFRPTVDALKGEPVATAVGFAKTDNVGFDFGVYDMRKDNGTGGSTDQARHGVCWLRDWLPPADSAILAALPGGDSKNGKTSDYCK